MFTVYILKSKIAKKSYVGFTNNLKRRLDEHNDGKNYYTKRYMPWEIIHIEEYAELKDAKNREKFFKSTSGRRSLKKIFAEKN